MVNERGSWDTDPVGIKGFLDLGEREQVAIRVALTGVRTWRSTGVEPKPMSVTITNERPFDLRAFAGMLHTLGIGISDSLKRDENTGAVTFQPKPYSGIPSTREPNSAQELMGKEFPEMAAFFREFLGKK